MKFAFRAALAMVVVMCASLFQACSDSPSKKNTVGFDTYFYMEIGGKPFRARLAMSDSEKARGLMGVKSLGENDGMIFVYDAPQKMSFWMKNTLIGLDLAYLDSDGKILEIKRLYPRSLDPVESASDKIYYCIEMNSGWFAKNGIKAGDRLNLDALGKAVEKRRP